MRSTTLAMASLATSTAWATTSAAGIFFHLAGHSSRLTARSGDICPVGQAACDASCIDAAFECCHVGQGQACQEGYRCYDQGCCREGQTCRGPPRGCTDTTKMCDVGCIARDRVCCLLGDGSSCDADTVCLVAGMCGRPRTALGPADGSSSSPAASGRTSASGSGGAGSATSTFTTKSVSTIGATVTASVVVGVSGEFSVITTTTKTTETAGDVSSAPSATKKPISATITGSSTPIADKSSAGAALKGPVILAALFAAAVYAV
ncbi:hypothetical protein CCM_04002 [Cordyceps militaris CM01]|uniref:Uncharacterized protein n=1 Tax=Cordyceps militaris (strain CM01) TaxID=983644 RepID=G3JDF4_CORMM|nr:uncharacterized protein CCM_04002 [Cordyceps militaris CM01]EGX92629.1 hypothetical protein CCM_04002 [Cordyceps militaris CM01]